MQVFGTAVTKCYCCLHLVTFFMSVKDLLPEIEPHCEILQTGHPARAMVLWTCVSEQHHSALFVPGQSCTTASPSLGSQ